MFIPKAKDLHSIMLKNHREKAYRQMLAKHAPKVENDFVKKLKTILSMLLNRIKIAVIYDNRNSIHYFGGGVSAEERERMFQVLTKVFTKKGFTVKKDGNSLKISW